MGAPTFLCTLLLLIVFINTTTAAASSSSSSQTYKIYVQRACNSTRYPDICYKSLSSYATSIKSNPQKLCNYALSVTLKAAKNASSTVSALSKKKGMTKGEAAVVKDCIANIKDSVDELKEAVTTMKNLGGADIRYQLADVKTWVSASLTDEDTCTDGFEDQNVSMEVKSTINKSVLTVAILASNALSLINNLSY